MIPVPGGGGQKKARREPCRTAFYGVSATPRLRGERIDHKVQVLGINPFTMLSVCYSLHLTTNAQKSQVLNTLFLHFGKKLLFSKPVLFGNLHTNSGDFIPNGKYILG